MLVRLITARGYDRSAASDDDCAESTGVRGFFPSATSYLAKFDMRIRLRGADVSISFPLSFFFSSFLLLVVFLFSVWLFSHSPLKSN